MAWLPIRGLAVVLSAVLPLAMTLPAPTGRAPVGTRVLYVADSTRRDADFPSGRPVTIQLWYPAASATGARQPYLAERGLRAALGRSEYYGVDSAALDQWAATSTHSVREAAPASGRHPLLAMSVGLGVIRANYTTMAEELASHGYIVALVESPLQGLMVTPDGRTVLDTAGRFADLAAHRAGVTAWSHDISVALDRLLSNTSPLAAHIDASRIGALGHSTGGLVAIATCERDARVRACINMDGGLAGPDAQATADFVTTGIRKPALFLRSQPLYDDTTLARRGMTRAEWEARGEAGRRAFEAFAARSPTPPTVAFVAGTGHFSFSDAPFVMPTTITRFGGRIIAPERGRIVITSALRAFFDGQFGRGGETIAGVAQRLPELTLAPPR